jgi:antitoxin component YwqK of YwqJK toxin-antitoxin module
MKTFICAILLITSSIIFGQDNPRYNIKETRIDNSNGLILLQMNGEPLTGIVFKHHANGQLEYEESYSDGLKFGDQIYYDKNGQIVENSFFLDGELASSTKYKYHNGEFLESYSIEFIKDLDFDADGNPQFDDYSNINKRVIATFEMKGKASKVKNENGEFIDYEYFVDGIKVSAQDYSEQYESYFVCFVENAPILNTENQEIKIKDVKPGMTVRTYNSLTKKMEVSVVKQLLEHKDKEYSLTKVVFINSNSLYASNSGELTLLEIQGTDNHPLLTNKGVKKIGELSLSDKLMYYNISTGLVEECEILNIVKNNKTVNAVYNLKFSNNNSFYLVNGIPASAKCPFVHVKINGEYQLVDEILRNQVSNKLDRVDVLEIPSKSISNGKLEVKIEEIKDEISFIDNIYLKIDDVIIYPSNNMLSEKLNSADNSFLQLNKGESINLIFEIPFTLTGNEKVVLNAKGYYDLLPEAK